MSVELRCGDCLEILPTLEAGSVDAVITDPPYGLSFMGKDWDHGVPGVPFWEAALRVAKPGAMLLAFGGTRTHHRLMCAIEDAGWEIRDCLMWLYGSGFPKSMDISKAIDKAAGMEREVIGKTRGGVERGGKYGDSHLGESEKWHDVTAPATAAARQWQGWGTALKPAWEPIIMAMKPIDGTFANNALVHGVAGIYVDGCRIDITDGATMARNNKPGANGWKNSSGGKNSAALNGEPNGRWPANLLLDEEAAVMLDAQSGERSVSGAAQNGRPALAANNGMFALGGGNGSLHNDSGGASRFFYVAKASRRDRNEGLEGMPEYTRDGQDYRRKINTSKQSDGGARGDVARTNTHPTVKPTQLMRYLCRLVTPPNGIVLDLFMGSGSTGKAAMLEGFGFVGIDKKGEYVEIARRRIEQAQMQMPLLEVNYA